MFNTMLSCYKCLELIDSIKCLDVASAAWIRCWDENRLNNLLVSVYQNNSHYNECEFNKILKINEQCLLGIPPNSMY